MEQSSRIIMLSVYLLQTKWYTTTRRILDNMYSLTLYQRLVSRPEQECIKIQPTQYIWVNLSHRKDRLAELCLAPCSVRNNKQLIRLVWRSLVKSVRISNPREFLSIWTSNLLIRTEVLFHHNQPFSLPHLFHLPQMPLGDIPNHRVVAEAKAELFHR